jgi:uncharacterized protein YqeY
MSQLKSQITEDIKAAMRAKDSLRLDTLRFLQSAIKNREIELRPAAINDDEVMGVLKKLIKQRKESIDQFSKAGRTDLAQKEQQELTYMEVYLPAQLDKGQVEALVSKVITDVGASGVKDMGKVMKEVLARAGGAADSKLVSEIVKSKLN